MKINCSHRNLYIFLKIYFKFLKYCLKRKHFVSKNTEIRMVLFTLFKMYTSWAISQATPRECPESATEVSG